MKKQEIEEVLQNQKKETDYCILLHSAKIKQKNTTNFYSIDKIIVKDTGTEELRFGLYKCYITKAGKVIPRLIARPLDLNEIELLDLLKQALSENMFSDNFVRALRQYIG